MSRTRPRPVVLVLAGLVGLVLTPGACSSSPDAPPAAAYTPPAWFATQAREREDAAAQMQACMSGRGWDRTVDEQGVSDEPFTDPAEAQRFGEDVATCWTDAGRPAVGTLTSDELHAVYRGGLDTARCLRSLGFTTTTPPAEDVWVEQQLGLNEIARTGGQLPDGVVVWSPYEGVLEQLAQDDDLPADYEQTCPTWWVG